MCPQIELGHSSSHLPQVLRTIAMPLSGCLSVFVVGRRHSQPGLPLTSSLCSMSTTPEISWNLNLKLLLEILEISWKLVDAPGKLYN